MDVDRAVLRREGVGRADVGQCFVGTVLRDLTSPAPSAATSRAASPSGTVASVGLVDVDGSRGARTAAGGDGAAVGAMIATGAAVGAGAVVATGVDIGAAVGTGACVAGVIGAAGPGAGATTWVRTFLTVAVQRTSEPPPFAEPLHWSTFTEKAEVIVDPVVTEQMNETLVPPLPEPLHWPTVAAATEVIPGVLTGVQLPGAPGPVITDPMH